MAHLLVRLRRPAGLAMVGLVLLCLALVVPSPRAGNRMLLVALAASLFLAGLEAAMAWRRFGSSCRPGMAISAAMRDDALVVRDTTGTATVPLRGIARVTTTRHAVVLRSQIRSVIVLPRALLSETDIARLTGAVDFYRAHR